MAKEKELSFEENLNNLETIVKDDAINKFTEAMKIAKTCDEKLKNAEENVNKILNKDGTLSEFKIEEE